MSLAYITTFSGRVFYPLAPDAGSVDVVDIAHSLSMSCRWNGHVRTFYSVAQHAVFVAELVERMCPHLAFAALHHDSDEAYLSDVPTPIKKSLIVAGFEGADRAFADAEADVYAAIAEALRIPALSERDHAVIKAADLAALRYEAEYLITLPADDTVRLIGLPMIPWYGGMSPLDAKDRFLETHARLAPKG